MVRSLDKKWKEFVFAFSGFGPNFLMVLMGSYFSDALNPAALEGGEQFQAITPGVCYILPALFPILYALSKVFDGIIDIPFAHITDNLSTRWGRRRPAIAVCLLPMTLSFILCWIPIGGADRPLLNTIWVTVFSLIFFATYTMSMISFYGSFSAVCTSESQQLRVSGYKSFFDTISYCFAYALVPVVLSATKMHIDQLVFLFAPLMLTMIIPLVMIKEGKKYGYPEKAGLKSEKLSLRESLRITFQNRIFKRWLLVNSFTFFGLQMFLSSMNGLIIGGMGLSGFQMAILNTCAFAPVPITLYLFNKAKVRYGLRATYRSCILVFAVAIMAFFFGSRFFLGEGNTTTKMAIGVIGSVTGSWSIGAFFMMPYLVPAQISGVEEKLIGKNHAAMYFAGNAVVSSLVGAISGNLIYEYIKNIFYIKGHGMVWAENPEAAYAASGAANVTNIAEVTFNIGNLAVPFIVALSCVLGFWFARKMPKNFTPSILAAEFKAMDPTLDTSAIEEEAQEERGEILFVQIGLTILSGFIFGFIWLAYLLKSLKEFYPNLKKWLYYLPLCVIPFAALFINLRLRKIIVHEASKNGATIQVSKSALILSSLLFPILPINLIALSTLQRGVNKVYLAQGN